MRVVNLILISFALPVFSPGQTQEGIPGTKSEVRRYHDRLKSHEVVIGTQIWSYSRIYPLLDGLLQDVAATQVSSLTLNPNTSNGSSLDALQQSFQLQLQYSQLAGVQNAAAAQVAGANVNYQNQLAQQGAQLLQQFTQAVTLATQAQSNVNALTAAPGTNPTDLAAAQQVLTNANSQVTSLGGMIANLKNLPAPTVPGSTSALASAPTLPTVGGSGLPGAVTTNATTVTNGSPSFPATKQMDNQMDLLWERLSRLVGVMAKPDNMGAADDIFLVKFDTGIYPLERKKQLLDVTYKLSCGKVIDMFPRSAALNITEDKYRDTAFGLGAVLNFFGIGSSVAYNREHLRVSQLLGQSSYITGRGVGREEFGWLFGLSLGDDSISPGARTTFALVDVPQSCNGSDVILKSEAWTKSSEFTVKGLQKFSDISWQLRPAGPSSSAPSSGSAPTPATPASTLVAGQSCGGDCIASIDFNRAEYDPAAGKAPVMITVVLNQDMDQQQTVTANGLFIPRVRDNFGRAIATGGSSGVLEAQGSLATNTWIPANQRTMLLTLDGALFGDRFPRILLSSPRGLPIDVSSSQAIVTVSGRKLNCQFARLVAATAAGTPAAAGRQDSCLPSLAFQKSVPTNLQIARWIESGAATPIDKLSITMLSAAPPGALSTASGLPSVQVVSDQDTPAWGSNPEVDWLSPENEMRPLTCVPGAGSRLVCDAPDQSAQSNERPAITLLVIDQNHPGGPIKGLVSTVVCNGAAAPCRHPLLWKTNPPQLMANTQPDPATHLPDLAASKWVMKLLVVNVDPADKASLNAPPFALKAGSAADGAIDCSGPAGKPCTATFTIHRNDLNMVADLMVFQVTKADGSTSDPFFITNVLTNVRPWISQINADFTAWWGENLVYDTIRINTTEVTSPMLQCSPDGTFCSVVKPGYDSSVTAGLMYFVIHNPEVLFPFVQVNSSAANSPIVYAPPKAPGSGADQKAASSLLQLPNSQIGGTIRQLMKAQDRSVQGFQ